jgi:murein DD-endopeptidase MepM/ murein hydrolase activator NlpD
MEVKLTNGYRVLYGHMSKLAQNADGTLRKVGDTIKQNDQVGLVGTTGLSTGNHLHLEIREGTIDDNLNYFSRKYLDPIALLPVTEDMLTADALAKVDKTKLMEKADDKQTA